MSTEDFRYPLSTVVRRDNNPNLPPLILSSNGHPSYQPFKLNIKTSSDLKMHKVKLPEKPMAPFMRFSKKVFDQVKQQNPEAKQWELGRIIQQMWKDLGEQEKNEYINEYENAKFDYSEQLKAFHNSPQYQSFLSSNAAKKTNKLPVGNGTSSQLVNNNPTLTSLSNKTDGQSTIYSTALSHYAIEAADDDGIDESMSSKSLASIRFQRNHRLLNEIFNEFCVQDNRSIVTQQRMEQLKKQVASLETHQEKLKQELAQIEDKYESKKRKFLNSSQDFEKEMQKLKEFKVSEEQENQYYTKHYEQMQKQWKEYTENFAQSVQTKTITKEGAHTLLRDGLDNLINNNNATKSLMSISNPTVVTIVALQQPVETPAPTPTPSQTPAPTPTPAAATTATAPAAPVTATTEQPAPPTAHHVEPQIRPQLNQYPGQAPNQMMPGQPRFNPPPPAQSPMPNMIRPNMTPNVPPTQMPPNGQMSYMNPNMNQPQFNTQQQQFRSTNTPPTSSVNNAIISPNNQAQGASTPGGVQSPAPNRMVQPTPQPQMATQMQPQMQGQMQGQMQPQMAMPQQQTGQIRPQVQPGQTQPQMMPQHPMQMNQQQPQAPPPNMNYYHQPHMNQMPMYNQPAPPQSQPGQSAQPQQQFNPNMAMMPPQQHPQQMNYQNQMANQMTPNQTPGQPPMPPQYPNSMHQQAQMQGQMQPQMQGQMMYPQQNMAQNMPQNMPMYNQQGQPQAQMMMMQQQQFGQMYPNQGQMPPQNNMAMMPPNQYPQQGQPQQQQQQPQAQQAPAQQAKGEKKSKEDKPKKKSSKKAAANE